MGDGKRAIHPKLYQLYPTTMKLGTIIPYIKKLHKTSKSRNNFFSSANISIFCWKSATFVTFCYIVSNYFNLFESSKVVLINKVAILMTSAKLATLAFLKIEVFWNKGYDIKTSVHEDTNKIFITQIKFYCRCGHVIKNC